MLTKIKYIIILFVFVSCKDDEPEIFSDSLIPERYSPSDFDQLSTQEAENFINTYNADLLLTFEEFFDIDDEIASLQRFRELTAQSGTLDFSQLAYINLDELKKSILDLHVASFESQIIETDFNLPVEYEAGTYSWDNDSENFDLLMGNEEGDLEVVYPMNNGSVNDLKLKVRYFSIDQSFLSKNIEIFDVSSSETEDFIFSYRSGVGMAPSRAGGNLILDSFNFNFDSGSGLSSQMLYTDRDGFDVELADTVNHLGVQFFASFSTRKSAWIGLIESSNSEEPLSIYFESYPQNDSIYGEINLPNMEKKIGDIITENGQTSLMLEDGTSLSNSFTEKIIAQIQPFLD